jgi:peptidoglycan/LPS O-acetylase OafA/YrhL
MDSLMFGCLLALVWRMDWYAGVARRFAAAGGPILGTIFVLLVSPWLGGHFRDLYNVSVRYSLEGLAIVLVMDWLVRHPGSGAGWFLNSRPVMHLGLISYSLYLWQQPFLPLHPANVFQSAPLNLIAAFACAEASYWIVEKNFKRFRARLRAL